MRLISRSMAIMITHWVFFALIPFALATRRSVDGTTVGFREMPRNQSVLVGSDVTFRCSAANRDPEYDAMSQWRTNTGALLGYEARVVTGMSAGRYNYIQESTEELHLHISNVTLGDDGTFECQMSRRGNKILRAPVHLTVLVPPADTFFEHYQASSTIEVNEGSPLNITCVGLNAKPKVSIKWYVFGKSIQENIYHWDQVNPNGTTSSYAALSWRPSKKDHNKLLTCEIEHPETKTQNRISLTMKVLYSSEIPEIEVISPTERIKAGQNVSLTCLAEGGNPPPRLTWFAEGSPVQTQYEYDFASQITRSTFSFVAEESTNGAEYECVSLNRENALPLKATKKIEVDYPPNSVGFVNVSTSVRRGNTISLTCRSTLGSPAPIINWKLNGLSTSSQPQFENKRPHGTFTESTIGISTREFSSEVQEIAVDCTAVNDEGSATKQHIVRILSPPMTPTINSVATGPMLEGKLLNLTCESSGGNPLATLSWLRGIEKLTKGTHNTVDGSLSRSSISIMLDRTMNKQPIRCEATNAALDYPLNATTSVTVLFPPRAVDVRVEERGMRANEPARLFCNVPSSNPVAEIHWEVESTNANKPILFSGEHRYNRSDELNGGFEVENYLNFVPTSDMDGLTMRCVATHPLWETVKSGGHKLNIIYPPQIKVDSPMHLTFNEGDSFTEQIAVAANPPVQIFRWKKNGESFMDTTGAVFVSGPTIGGRGVSRDDTGSYLLIVDNGIGQANLTLRITVNYPAQIVRISSPVYADVGEDVVLECHADGSPRRHGMVKWMKGGVTLRATDQDDKRAVLRIGASHESSGAYTCVADNGIGQPNYTNAYLLIKTKPQIRRNLGFDRAAGPIRGRAVVRCVAHAVPATEFHWALEDGTEIIYNSTRFTVTERQLDQTTFESDLTINHLSEADYNRRIRCRVSNNKGSDIALVTVGPPTAPDRPYQLTVVKVNDSSALLTWIPGFDGGSDQTYEVRIQTREDREPMFVNVTNSEILLRDLKPLRLYYAQVRSINEDGRSSELSIPATPIRTKSENGTELASFAEEGLFSGTFLITLIGLVIVLLTINCVVFGCYLRHKRRSQVEKTAFTRRADYENGRRPLHFYGAIGNGGVVHSPATMGRRPDSNNTNKSELANEPMSEDEQSVRTMIQVSPHVLMQRHPVQQPNRFHDGNFAADEFDPACYSVINKNVISDYASSVIPDGTRTYVPAHGSPSLAYAEFGGTLRRGMDSPRRFGSVAGSLVDTNRNFNTMGSTNTLPRNPPSFSTFGGPHIVGNVEGDLV